MSIILQIIAGLYVFAVTLAFGGLAYLVVSNRAFKNVSEVDLLKAQADHVRQTAAREKADVAESVKAYEAQGVNKFRTEIARLGGNLAEIEKQLGSKIKAVSLEVHTQALKNHEEVLAETNKVIADLKAQRDIAA